VKISIIIPAFNEERLLGASLRQIKAAAGAFTARGWEVELIVCDNNSTDRTSEIAYAAGADVVFEPVNQIARARNSGAAAASGDWFIFVDADSHPRAELFSVSRNKFCPGNVSPVVQPSSWTKIIGSAASSLGHGIAPAGFGSCWPVRLFFATRRCSGKLAGSATNCSWRRNWN
jgi:glycosyltransferase involved in cell wall biosynthesis